MPDGENIEERWLDTIVVRARRGTGESLQTRAEELGNMYSYTAYTSEVQNPNYGWLDRDFNIAAVGMSEGIDYNTYLGTRGFSYVGAFYDAQGNAAEYYMDINALARNPENGPVYFRRPILQDENNMYGTGFAEELDALPPEIEEKLGSIREYDQINRLDLMTEARDVIGTLSARRDSISILNDPFEFGQDPNRQLIRRNLRGIGNDLQIEDQFVYYGVQELPDGRTVALFRSTPLYIDGVQQNAGMVYTWDVDGLFGNEEAGIEAFSSEPVAAPELMPFVVELDEGLQRDRAELLENVERAPLTILWGNGDSFTKVSNGALVSNYAMGLDEEREYAVRGGVMVEYRDAIAEGVDPVTGYLIYRNDHRPDFGALVDPQSGEIVYLFNVREDNGMIAEAKRSIVTANAVTEYAGPAIDTGLDTLTGTREIFTGEDLPPSEFEANYADFAYMDTADYLVGSNFERVFRVRPDLARYGFYAPSDMDIAAYYANQGGKVAGQEVYEAGTGFLVMGGDVVDAANNLPRLINRDFYQVSQLVTVGQTERIDASIFLDDARNDVRDVLDWRPIERENMSGFQMGVDDVVTVGEVAANTMVGGAAIKSSNWIIQGGATVAWPGYQIFDGVVMDDDYRLSFYAFAEHGDHSGLNSYEDGARRYLLALASDEAYSPEYRNVLALIGNMEGYGDNGAFRQAAKWLVDQTNGDITNQPMNLALPAYLLSNLCVTEQELISINYEDDFKAFLETGDENRYEAAWLYLQARGLELSDDDAIENSLRSRIVDILRIDNSEEFRTAAQELLEENPLFRTHNLNRGIQYPICTVN